MQFLLFNFLVLLPTVDFYARFAGNFIRLLAEKHFENQLRFGDVTDEIQYHIFVRE